MITALFAATIAVAQNDIKKVLAYSTVSQLGYMFLAVGSGAYVAAIFHMVTHAFFKALLFLGSGSVIHGMHDEQDMRYMGLLRKAMPITAATFIVGWLAIAGVPPFAGFWSKDEILLFALAKSPALYIVGLVTALLTAYYMTRQVVMVFFGEARWDDRAAEHGAHGDIKPHESPWIMLTPLVVLAGLSIVGGIIQLPDVSWSPTRSACASSTGWSRCRFGEADIAGTWAYENKTILMLIAIAVAVRRHRRRLARVREAAARGRRADGARQRAGTTTGGQRRSWAGPAEAFEASAWFDANVVDGAVDGAARRCASTAGGAAQGPDRVHPRLRRRHRHRCRRAAARLVRGRPGDALMEVAPASRSSTSIIAGRPSFGAPRVMLSAERRPELVQLVGLLAAILTGGAGDLAARRVRRRRGRLPVRDQARSGSRPWGISWHLGVDGISLMLVVLTGVLFPLSILGTDPHHDEGRTSPGCCSSRPA